MTFRPDVDLDPGRVRDTRGRRVRGGGLAIGGGMGTLIIVALILLSGGNLGDIIGGLPAALYEWFAGVKDDSSETSLWIWLAGTGILTIPAIGNFFKIGL